MQKFKEIKEINIYKPTVARAEALAKEMGTLRGSFLKGEGNVRGMIGELVLANQLSVRHKSDNTNFSYHYDLKYKGMKIDVKTKGCTSKPLDTYEASVNGWNTKQKCDVYYFARVQKGYKKAWLLGGLTPEEFYDKAVFWEKGQRDPSNGWLVKSDHYSVKIDELKPFKKLLKEHKIN